MRPLVALLALVFIVVAVVIATSSSSSKEEQPAGPSQSDLATTTNYSNIYVLDVTTRHVTELTKNEDEQIAQGPAWSSRGRIVYSEAFSDESFASLYLLDPRRPKKKRVPAKVRHLFQPSWAPDGREVAANRLGKGIYAIDVRTGSTRRLTREGYDEAPAWSPDGKTIVFEKQVSGSNRDIYVMDADGHGAHALAHSRRQETNPAWSPDGRAIAFAEQGRTGNRVIYRMAADGSGRRRLTSPSRSCQEPAWSPDGKRIAFIGQRGAEAWVGMIPAGGGKPVRLTDRSLFASGPAWSPDGREIAFSAKAVTKGEQPAD
jgi:TolB protein